MARLEPSASEDLGDGIGKAVLQGIVEEDFASSAVDALLSMVWAGGSGEVLGDVLAYLSQHQHPEWAAELCRMVMAGPDGSATDRDFTAVAAAMAHMVQAAPVELARKVCTYILEIKDNGQGGNFFDCYDISLVLGHMVLAGFAAPAGQILYDLYCDSTDQGQMYQVLVPHVLGTLIDKGYANWAIELSKQLMYEDGERSIDYTVMGWTMAQMVYCGRHDWAAGICDGLLAQHLRWYNQGAMLQAVSAWDPTYTQAIIRSMTPAGYSNTPGGGGGGRQQYTYHRGGGGGGGQHQSYGGGRNNSARNFTGGRGVGAAQNGNHGLHTAMEGLKVRETNGPVRGSGQAVAAAPTGSTARGNDAAAAAVGTTAAVASPGGTTLAPSAREFTPNGPVPAAPAAPASAAESS